VQRKVSSPAEYLDAVPEAQLPLVQHLRSLIQQAAPEAREEIRWGMLCYDDSGALFAIAAQKHFVGLYVMATQALAEMADELQALDHGKGCIRFKRLQGVPSQLVSQLLVRAKGCHERECRHKH
jgi:uncharacterized protein YdhG (YjbR/CyaY superfamily)